MDMILRESLSRRLLAFAWVVEIIAVVIGFGISIVVGLDGWEALATDGELTVTDTFNIMIGAAPFLIIAAVELTKIPLSGAAYYASRWYWKVLFGAALVIVALITFETMFNGMERQFSSLKYSLETKLDKQQALHEERSSLLTQRAEASALTLENIEAAYNERIDVITADFEEAAAAIDAKYEAERAGTVSEYADVLRSEVEAAEQALVDARARHERELSGISQDRNRDRQAAEAALNRKRSALAAQIQEKTQEISTLTAQKNELNFLQVGEKERIQQQIDAAIARRDELQARSDALLDQDSAAKVEDDNAAMLARHRSEIEALNARRTEAAQKLAAAVTAFESGQYTVMEQIRAEKAPFVEKMNQQRAEAEERRSTQLADLDSREEQILEINAKLENVEAELLPLREAIAAEGRDNQVMRLAATYYDVDSMADLSGRQIGNVAAVWFGSLAFIVAFTGILLALGSYAVRTPPNPDRKGFVRTMRSLIAAWNRQKREPQVVEKEVEVEKVVYQDREVTKTVEVEVPVLVTKYVPYPATPAELRAIVAANRDAAPEPDGELVELRQEDAA